MKDPDEKEFYKLRGRCYRQMGELNKALDGYHTVLKPEKDKIMPSKVGFAILLVASEKYSEAKAGKSVIYIYISRVFTQRSKIGDLIIVHTFSFGQN